jgi:hypothetical protein
MNKKGDIVLGLFFFVLAMGMVFALIPIMKVFIDMQQQSNNLNCYGYIHNGNVNNSLSYNATLNGGNSGSPLGCSAIKLYIPYLLLVFLIFGVMKIMYGGFQDFFGGGGTGQ